MDLQYNDHSQSHGGYIPLTSDPPPAYTPSSTDSPDNSLHINSPVSLLHLQIVCYKCLF